VTRNPNIIYGLKPVVTTPMVVAGGETHVVGGKGSVYVKFPNGETKRIDDVLYVLSIRWNLLFIGCIFNQSCTIQKFHVITNI
jgi:hypothetical protein